MPEKKNLIDLGDGRKATGADITLYEVASTEPPIVLPNRGSLQINGVELLLPEDVTVEILPITLGRTVVQARITVFVRSLVIEAVSDESDVTAS